MPVLETWDDLQMELQRAALDWRWLAARAMAGYGLTARERDVVWRLFRGETNAEIGFALAIADQTVKHHLTHVFAKLCVTSREQVILRLLGVEWREGGDGVRGYREWA